MASARSKGTQADESTAPGISPFVAIEMKADLSLMLSMESFSRHGEPLGEVLVGQLRHYSSVEEETLAR